MKTIGNGRVLADLLGKPVHWLVFVLRVIRPIEKEQANSLGRLPPTRCPSRFPQLRSTRRLPIRLLSEKGTAPCSHSRWFGSTRQTAVTTATRSVAALHKTKANAALELWWCDYCSCNRKRTQCTNAVFNTNKQTQLHTRLIERLPGSAYRSLHSSFMAISDSP